MRITIIVLFAMLFGVQLNAKTTTDNADIPTMETGGQKMPDVWIDKDTGHKVVKLTQ